MNFLGINITQLLRFFRANMLLVLVVLIGSWLRTVQFAQFPVAGETSDEIAWTMQGSSLWQTGIPQSWSYFKSYTHFEEKKLGSSLYRIVTPSVDHPPLFGLIPGTVATLQGTPWNELPSIKAVRAPMVALSILNLVLFAWLADRWFSEKWSRNIAVLLFAVVPAWIFLQRLVVSENLLLTWTLLLLLASSWEKARAWTFVGAISIIFLPLTKISGLAIAVAALVSIWKRPVRARFWWWLAAFFGGIAVLLAYFSWVDWSLFLQVQQEQSQRDTGLLTLFSTQIWSKSLVLHSFAEPWTLLGLIATMILVAVRDPKKLQLRISSQTWNMARAIFIASLAFIFLSVGEHTIHGWYRIIFFPFFALSLASGAELLWRTKSLVGLSMAWLILAVVLRQGLWFGMGSELFVWQSILSKIWLLGAAILVAAEFLLQDEKIRKRIFLSGAGILLAVIIVSSLVTIVSINAEAYWLDSQYIQTGLRP